MSTTSRTGAVASAVYPPTSAPSSCSPSFSGTFEITVVNVTASKKRDFQKRAEGVLTLTLNNSILHDSSGRTGYIAANDQFQFDGPPQAGAIYTAGFSLCPNNSLALGGSTIWYQCLSGTFYNLYDVSQGGQCNQVYINAIDETGTILPATSISTGSSRSSSSTSGVSSAIVASTTSSSNTTSSALLSSKTSSTTPSSGIKSTASSDTAASASAASSSASASASASSATSKSVTVASVMKLLVTFGIISSMLMV